MRNRTVIAGPWTQFATGTYARLDAVWGAGSAELRAIAGVSDARSIAATDDRLCIENGTTVSCWAAGETSAVEVPLLGVGP